MEKREIFQYIDHTLLKQEATWEQIQNLCDEGMKYGVASVCIPPVFVRQAAEYLKGKIPVCTVIGFPNGYQTTEVKVFEANQAIKDGAEELDMVINLGWVKEKRYHEILTEINALKAVCQKKILKVIVETALLTEEEKTKLCEVVSSSKAEYIKTSTGFAGGGATKKDIHLFQQNVKNTKIKAAGGIKSVSDAEDFLKLGADRLGSSSLLSLLKQAIENDR